MKTREVADHAKRPTSRTKAPLPKAPLTKPILTKPPLAKPTKPPLAKPTKPPRAKTPPTKPRATGKAVAVGASAGGLQALESLLQPMPRDFAAPVIVVLHLDPDHTSNAASLLQRHTKLRVKQAEAGERPQPGTVYLARPDHHLEIKAGLFTLPKSPRIHYSRPSVDRLFESVAAAYGDQAIAVVLSGTGTDGHDGVAAIKAAGGLAVAEHKSTALHSSMPDAAVLAGADAVLPVSQMAGFLVRALKEKPAVSAAQWRRVLQLVKQRSGTDFTGYRGTTLHRRLQKRMDATHQETLAGYLKLLAGDPTELDRLHASFLIKVSSFRRDPGAWHGLLVKAIRPFMKTIQGSHEVRAWSAGCATGEEAYTLAAMLLDAAPASSVQVKVFATDIDDGALATARLGHYSDVQLRNLTDAQRKRHFVRHEGGWKVNAQLRKHVVFGHHNLLRDPPLPAMDFVVCRNVLIYLDPIQKQEALSRLSYALRAGGHLFLGRSEGAKMPASGFVRVAGRNAIFKRLQTSYVLPGEARPSQANDGEIAKETSRGSDKVVTEAAFQHLLLESASVILFAIGADRRILLWNAAAHAFFGLPAAKAIGRPVYEALPGVVADQLGSAIQAVMADVRTRRVQNIMFRAADKSSRVLDLDCIPFRPTPSGGAVLCVGTDVTTRHQAELRQAAIMQDLGQASTDAAKLNEVLMATNEEMETVNEELQATSEEHQALNDELQSRNEELQTVNEELQSTNEELSTLGEDVRLRTDEAERATLLLGALLDANKDTMIGCTNNGTITFWSRMAGKRFMLSGPQALGKDLFTIIPALNSRGLRKAVAAAPPKPSKPQVEILVRRGRVPMRVTVLYAMDDQGRRHGCLLRIQDARAHRKQKG